MLVSIEGLPGPVIVKRLRNRLGRGQDLGLRPRSRHFSLSVWPPVPRMSMFSRAPIHAAEEAAAYRNGDRVRPAVAAVRI
jgi:hypothetical protein